MYLELWQVICASVKKCLTSVLYTFFLIRRLQNLHIFAIVGDLRISSCIAVLQLVLMTTTRVFAILPVLAKLFVEGLNVCPSRHIILQGFPRDLVFARHFGDGLTALENLVDGSGHILDVVLSPRAGGEHGQVLKYSVKVMFLSWSEWHGATTSISQIVPHFCSRRL